MMVWNKIPFEDILIESRDGEWGEGEAQNGFQLCEVIRGTDFSSMSLSEIDLPKRWIQNHLIERKKLLPLDLIFEMAGGTAKQSTGRSALITRSFFLRHQINPLLCASFCRHLRVNQEKYSPQFIYFLLQALYNAGYMAVFNIQHTGVSRFQYTTFKKMTHLNIPPLPIQRKIAAILSAYDDLIENNNRRIAILEKMAEELYREWFVRLRFPGHEKVKIVKGVPEKWEIMKIGDFVISTMGQSPSSEFYNQNGAGLPFNQGVGTYGKRFPKKEVFCDSKGRIAEKGDILISVRAPVGRLNIADCKMIIGRGLAASCHKEKFNSYLYYFLRNTFSSEDIIGNGAIFNAVTKDELLGFKTLYPLKTLIAIFDKSASTIDKEIELLIKKIELFTISRDRLLSRLMSGKIDVENLDIHFPASMREEKVAA
jgi:type I restriction enzyme, S subunit